MKFEGDDTLDPGAVPGLEEELLAAAAAVAFAFCLSSNSIFTRSRKEGVPRPRHFFCSFSTSTTTVASGASGLEVLLPCMSRIFSGSELVEYMAVSGCLRCRLSPSRASARIFALRRLFTLCSVICMPSITTSGSSSSSSPPFLLPPPAPPGGPLPPWGPPGGSAILLIYVLEFIGRCFIFFLATRIMQTLALDVVLLLLLYLILLFNTYA
mmetsp:Transcript_2549/g.5940  ORF Transcript_2549/g.5940 Transcript_2549/m.5940 type:complete len:211 (-) Transcript_2549:51-683(-)